MSGTQLVPFDTFMQGFSKVIAKPRRPGSRVSTGEWAPFGPRTIATRSPKKAGIRVAQVTAGTRCYTRAVECPRGVGAVPAAGSDTKSVASGILDVRLVKPDFPGLPIVGLEGHRDIPVLLFGATHQSTSTEAWFRFPKSSSRNAHRCPRRYRYRECPARYRAARIVATPPIGRSAALARAAMVYHRGSS